MATRRISIPYRDMALKVVGPLGDYLAARIQRLDMPVNIPSTDIDELGNPEHAGVTTDIAEVTATFQAMDVSLKLFAALTGTDVAAFPGAGVDINELGEVDLVGVVQSATIADYVKSVHLRKCQVTGFTFTYSVDAESTEEYTVSGSEKTWFANDVIIEHWAAAIGSPQTLTHTPIVRKNGNYCISVILDGDYLDETAAAPATGQYRCTAGGVLSFADVVATQLVAVYHANPAGNNWLNVNDQTIPAAIRGKNVPVEIAANGIARVQSVTIRGTFPNEMIKEMGNTVVVGTIIQVPQVTGDITVLDTDTELISLFTTGVTTASGVTEWRSCEFTASGVSLEIQIQDPADGCADVAPTILKTVYIPAVTITSEGHTTNVGGNANQTFGFKSTDGTCVLYSGARP